MSRKYFRKMTAAAKTTRRRGIAKVLFVCFTTCRYMTKDDDDDYDDDYDDDIDEDDEDDTTTSDYYTRFNTIQFHP